MEFLFTFFLFRNLLKNDLSQRFKFSKRNAIVAVVIIVAFFITSASLVRITRGSTENFLGASKELRQLKDNMIFSPSIYLYLSSCVGVLNQYLYSDSEETGFGQNTFLPGYFILAKLGVLKRPSEFQKGYFIPLWTNTGTYIRELHADFGITGVYLVPYLIGLLVSWLWFKFYEKKNLFILVFLVYLYLIIGFSFLVMVTRVIYWFISIVVILLYLPVLKKLAIILGNRYNKNLESLS